MLSVALVLASPSVFTACSPTFNWREQYLPDVGLATSFPCRPDRHSRRLTLAGREVQMEMLACAAGGATYAVGFFDVATPADAPSAVSALRSAWIGNIQSQDGASAPPPPQPIAGSIPGMSPNPGAGQWALAAHRPDGSALAARGAFFSHGSRIYQALVVGSALGDEAVEPFYAGLKFPG